MSPFGVPSMAQPDQLLTGGVCEQAFPWVWLMDGDSRIHAVSICNQELLNNINVTATLKTCESHSW